MGMGQASLENHQTFYEIFSLKPSLIPQNIKKGESVFCSTKFCCLRRKLSYFANWTYCDQRWNVGHKKTAKLIPPVTIKTVLAGQESFFLRFTRNILTPFGDNIVNIKQSGGLMRPRYW